MWTYARTLPQTQHFLLWCLSAVEFRVLIAFIFSSNGLMLPQLSDSITNNANNVYNPPTPAPLSTRVSMLNRGSITTINPVLSFKDDHESDPVLRNLAQHLHSITVKELLLSLCTFEKLEN